MSLSAKKYEPLLNEGKDELDDGHRREYGLQLPMNNRKKDRTIKLLVALNLGLAALLVVLVVVLWREKSRVPAPPYSPAWEAVRYVNKRFAKDERFFRDNETDAEVDKIWVNLTGRKSDKLLELELAVQIWKIVADGLAASNGHVKFDTEEARKNVPSVELYYDPGYYLYGLNMFHQLHCLVCTVLCLLPSS